MGYTLVSTILVIFITDSLAQYYVVNYPEQQQQYFYQQPQQNYQQLYRPQPSYQQQLVQQPQFQQQYYQPQQQVYQPVPQPPPAPNVPQQQYQQPQPPAQLYQQALPQSAQRYQQGPSSQYQQPQPTQQYQQVAQPTPQHVRTQPPRPQIPNIQEHGSPPELEKPVKVISANTYEFDLPPPPPSRFLPDEDRVKILQNTKQFELSKSTRPQRPPQHRVVSTSEGRPHRVIHQERTQPVSTTTTPILTTVPVVTTTVATEVNDHVSHLSPLKKSPNKYFLQCCKNKKVAKSCESRCNFDNINKKILTAMFLGSDPCPQSYGLDLFACAAQDSDHTPCCRVKNVQRTSAGEKCLAFCNLRPDSHFQADASYLPCWAVLNDVKTCFKDAIISGEIIQ